MEVRTINDKYIELFDVPNECPYCHHTITPNYQTALVRDVPGPYRSADVFYSCSNKACQRGFIAVYQAQDYSGHTVVYKGIARATITEKAVSRLIQSLSPEFNTIYNQAYASEQFGLIQICGLGYRKAIEFLIKDYLVSKKPDKEES